MSEVEQSISGSPSRDERARAAREALIGKTVAGRYVLRAVIGHGGMGAVYEAEHLGLGKRVAIKFVDPDFVTDEQVLARFAREARAMSAIESAHIVTVFDVGAEDGRPYLVMELLRGEDVGQRLRRLHKLPVAEALHIVAQVLKGLAKAHAAGIIHRDLKPDNVFLVKHDSDPVFAKIVDFGVSKIERPRASTSPLALTGRGTVLGTPFYMAPEQAQAASDVDARADIFSVGAILFECLTGRPPHTGETYEQVILSICMRDAPDIRAIDPSLSPELAAFVARSLSRDRAQRFTSAERMLAGLHEVAPEERLRVPLERGAPETLLSPGNLAPHLAPPATPPSLPLGSGGGATRVGVGPLAEASSAPATIVGMPPMQESARGTPVIGVPSTTPEGQPPRSRSELDPSLSAYGLPSAKRSPSRLVVTAVVATLLGVGATLAVLAVVGKKPHSEPTPQAPTITSALSSAPQASGAPAPLPSAQPPAPSIAGASSAAPPPSPRSSAPPTKVVAPAGKPRPGPKPKPGPGNLDISRDLE